MLKKRNIELLLLMALFSVGASAFLFLVGQDALDGRHPFQFFADSNTYRQTYAGDSSSFDGTLIGVSSNYLGPLLVLNLLRDNIYLVLFFNIYAFTHSIIHISRMLGLDPLKVALLLLMSPLTVSSLLSVNKEVFLFPFLAFALNGHMRRSIFSVALALMVSVLVRWQFTVFYLLMLLLIQLPLVRSRTVVLAGLLLGISGVYLLMQPWIEPVLATVALSIENYEGGGSGLFELELGYQNQGLYFLIFPIKAAHLLFGMGFKVGNIFNPVEIYNDLFVGGHSAIAFLVFVTLVKRRLFTMRSDLIFASVIFLAIFGVTPVFAPRYLFFGFILWVLMLAGAPLELQRRSKASRHRSTPATNEPARPVRTTETF